MKLFSYCIPIDDGAAPNPYWDLCTLVICKPVIRRVAEEGDWIVGVGSKNVNGADYSGKLVYAMKITDKKKLRKYDAYCRTFAPDKIPDIVNPDYRRRVGDCLYDYSNGEILLRDSVHNKDNVDRDLKGEYALLSKHFYYFGNAAVQIPSDFKVLVRQGQGHQSVRNESVKEEFIKWLESNHERNKLYGSPQMEVSFSSEKGSTCASIHCSEAQDDESQDYSEERLPLSHWNYFLALEADLKIISRYIEIHESNFPTFSIGLAQVFLATCSEIDVVLKELSFLMTGREAANIKEYYSAVFKRSSSIFAQEISLPLHRLKFKPWSSWIDGTSPDWWTAYNHIKHQRNIHYASANLGYTLTALAALYVVIYHLVRVHLGKPEGPVSSFSVYKFLKPKQELFLMEGEETWRDQLEGRFLFGK